MFPKPRPPAAQRASSSRAPPPSSSTSDAPPPPAPPLTPHPSSTSLPNDSDNNLTPLPLRTKLSAANLSSATLPDSPPTSHDPHLDVAASPSHGRSTSSRRQSTSRLSFSASTSSSSSSPVPFPSSSTAMSHVRTISNRSVKDALLLRSVDSWDGGSSLTSSSGVGPPLDTNWLGTKSREELEQILISADCVIRERERGLFLGHLKSPRSLLWDRKTNLSEILLYSQTSTKRYITEKTWLRRITCFECAMTRSSRGRRQRNPLVPRQSSATAPRHHLEQFVPLSIFLRRLRLSDTPPSPRAPGLMIPNGKKRMRRLAEGHSPPPRRLRASCRRQTRISPHP